MNITLEPNPSSWAELAQRHFDQLDEDSLAARAEVGLPTDRPIIASGHQPALWHPGIVAKVFAMDSLCQRIGGASLWIVVDTDEVSPDAMEAPRPAAEHQLELAQYSLSASRETPGVQPRDRPFVPDESLDDRIRSALIGSSHAESAAEQVTRAALGLLGVSAKLLAVSALHRSSTFRSVFDAIRRDAEPLALAYNAAVRSDPEAGLAPLREHPLLGWELPFWRLEGAERDRLYEYEIDVTEGHKEAPEPELAPRAIAMTAMVRSSLADLFLHGTGGAVYDRVAERWAQGWSGWPLPKLSPIGVATADVLLPIAEEFPLDAADGSHEAWLAHRARHDPECLNDDAASAIKRRFLGQIRKTERSSHERRSLYKAMHAALEGYRTKHRDEIASLDEAAGHASARRLSIKLAHSRTWPFVLHPLESIEGLRESIEERINATGQAARVGRV